MVLRNSMERHWNAISHLAHQGWWDVRHKISLLWQSERIKIFPTTSKSRKNLNQSLVNNICQQNQEKNQKGTCWLWCISCQDKPSFSCEDILETQGRTIVLQQRCCCVPCAWWWSSLKVTWGAEQHWAIAWHFLTTVSGLIDLYFILFKRQLNVEGLSFV